MGEPEAPRGHMAASRRGSG